MLFSSTGFTAVIEETQLHDTLLAVEEINAAGGVNGREILPIPYQSSISVVGIRELRRVNRRGQFDVMQHSLTPTLADPFMGACGGWRPMQSASANPVRPRLDAGGRNNPCRNPSSPLT
ncbi:MAG TPA: transporter substrate-binding protein [Acetobacteraceae bacterium]|nr:transporter substrate-binding protein [Acetobacteraceae bacterium]